MRSSLVALLSAALMFGACSSGSGTKDGGRDGAMEHAPSDGAPTDMETDAPVGASDADAAVPDDSAVPDGDTDAGAADADDAGVDGDALPADGSVGDTGVDGHDDQSGDRGVDGAADGASEGGLPCPTCGLYATFAPQGMQNSVTNGFQLEYVASFLLDIVNGSDQPVSLANVRVRYWFTSDSANWHYQCGPCLPGMSGVGIASIPARQRADSFLELSLGSLHLDAFSDTGPSFQTLIGDGSIFVPPTLQNDYSWATDPTLPDPRVTIYVGNTLVWGVEP
jgi:hypothetical protein